LKLDMSKLDATADQTKKVLESFGLITNVAEEKKKEEQQMRWFI